jgi:hypothetical protein
MTEDREQRSEDRGQMKTGGKGSPLRLPVTRSEEQAASDYLDMKRLTQEG